VIILQATIARIFTVIHHAFLAYPEYAIA
jgi:hypothetical protein